MIVASFVQFLAQLLIAGFLIRTVQRAAPNSTLSKALSTVY